MDGSSAGTAEDRVLATAHHILRTLNSSHTDDMARILSTFDDRLSHLSLTTSHANASGDSPSAPASDFGSHSGRGLQSSSSSDHGHGEEHDDEEEDEDADDDNEGRLPPALRSAEATIMRWDSGVADVTTFLWAERREDVKGYLEAVDSLNDLISSLCSSSPETSRIADHANNVLQVAMLRLEAEFGHLLQKHSEPADPDWMSSLVSNRSSFTGGLSFSSINSTSRRVEDDQDTTLDKEVQDEDCDGGEDDIAKSYPISDNIVDLLPSEVISDLFDIASRMLREGYGAELIQAYVSIRRPIVEESLLKLGQEKLTFEEVQRMPWELLEVEISKWNQAMKIVLGGLFPSEKQLCATIFVNSQAVIGECFIDVCKSSLIQLLHFGDAVAIGRRASEKLFKILDMYECLRDLLPSVESMFSVDVRSEAEGVLSRLGNAARGTFAEFESAIQKEMAKNPIPGGAVHPLTRYVMNYMKFLTEYTETMNQLLLERTSERATDQSPLSVVTVSLMEDLERNLDAKSKLYKDPALACLFLMNNVHYISQKVKASDVRKLVGDEWIKRNSGKLRQLHNSYRRTAWMKVLLCLRDEGINISGGSASSASRNVLKDRFKNFNVAFEENVRAQSSWIVPDPQLCTELRISITEMILPAYRAFLGRFQNHVDSRHPERYVKYTAEDLEGYLNELFEGSVGSLNKRKSFPATGSAQ